LLLWRTGWVRVAAATAAATLTSEFPWEQTAAGLTTHATLQGGSDSQLLPTLKKVTTQGNASKTLLLNMGTVAEATHRTKATGKARRELTEARNILDHFIRRSWHSLRRIVEHPGLRDREKGSNGAVGTSEKDAGWLPTGSLPPHQSTSPPPHQSTTLPVYQPTTPPPHQSTSPPPHQPTTPPAHHPTSPPVHQPTTPPAHQSTSPPAHQPTSLPVHQPTSPPVYQSTSPPVHQPTTPPVYQPTTPPPHQSTTPPPHHPTSPPPHHPTSPPPHHPTTPPPHQSTTPPAHHPTSPPVHHPTSPPPHQPIILMGERTLDVQPSAGLSTALPSGDSLLAREEEAEKEGKTSAAYSKQDPASSLRASILENKTAAAIVTYKLPWSPTIQFSESVWNLVTCFSSCYHDDLILHTTRRQCTMYRHWEMLAVNLTSNLLNSDGCTDLEAFLRLPTTLMESVHVVFSNISKDRSISIVYELIKGLNVINPMQFLGDKKLIHKAKDIIKTENENHERCYCKEL
ncbi:hypothetical protein U0070_021876, partial [Myodes glareolus]